jgi:hypothetical protein
MKRTVIAFGLIALFFAVAAQAQAPAPKPGPDQKKLEVWVGSWTVEGESKAGPLGPASKYTNECTFQMTIGGFVLEGRFHSKSASENMQGMQIVAYDSANKNYTYAMYFNDGVISDGTVTVSGNTWNWKGTVIAGGKQYQLRGTDVLSADFMSDTYTAEISTDGKTWVPWLEEKATRIKGTSKK